MKQLLILVSAMLVFASCGKSEDDPVKPTGPAKRTVIVYMSAENNLSSIADMDTTEMIAGSKNIGNDCNFLAFFDKATKSENPSIWRYQDGKKELVKQFDADFYNSDPEKMYEVLEWVKQNYPAKSYGLVLWGHASGWRIESDTVAVASNSHLRRAYGRDTGDNTNSDYGKWINIPTLASVLNHLSFKFDYIFCDCCNMGNAETAYELRKSTDYLIASPAEIPGLGAPYDKMTPYLFDTSGTTAYQKIIDIYADEYNSKEPLSVIKMSEMENLANATRVILQTLAPTADKEFDLTGLMYYDGSVVERLRVLYDMNDFLLQNASDNEYTQWKQSLDRAVIYKRIASTWKTYGHIDFNAFTATEERYGGMSMYIPRTFYNEYSYSKHYNSNYHQMQWYHAVSWNSYGW